MKEIKIVEVGNYICAVKLGRCPLFVVEYRDKKNDIIEGLREDFPNYVITYGGKKERAEAAKRIIMQKNMRNGINR